MNGLLRFSRPLLVGMLGMRQHTSHAADCAPAPAGRTETNKKLGRNKCKREATEMLMKFKAENCIPALSAAVSVNGNIVYKIGLGKQDLEQSTKCSGAMAGSVASITKLLTGYLAAKMLQQNECFTLDDTPLDWLRDATYNLAIIRNGDQLAVTDEDYTYTVRQMLSHQSGVRHHEWGDEKRFLDECPDIFESYAHVVNEYLVSIPGTEVNYSSNSCNILGAMMESAMDDSDTFRSWAEDEMEILGLRDTHFLCSKELFLNRNRGYSFRNGQYKVGEYVDYSWFWPSEGLISTVEDLVKFGNIMFLLTRSDRCGDILQKKHAKRMFKMLTEEIVFDQLPPYDKCGIGYLWHIGQKAVPNGNFPARHIENYFHTGSSRTGTSALLLRWEKSVAPQEDARDDPSLEDGNNQISDGEVPELIYQERKMEREIGGNLITVSIISNLQLRHVVSMAHALSEHFAHYYYSAS